MSGESWVGPFVSRSLISLASTAAVLLREPGHTRGCVQRRLDSSSARDPTLLQAACDRLSGVCSKWACAQGTETLGVWCRSLYRCQHDPEEDGVERLGNGMDTLASRALSLGHTSRDPTQAPDSCGTHTVRERRPRTLPNAHRALHAVECMPRRIVFGDSLGPSPIGMQ